MKNGKEVRNPSPNARAFFCLAILLSASSVAQAASITYSYIEERPVIPFNKPIADGSCFQLYSETVKKTCNVGWRLGASDGRNVWLEFTNFADGSHSTWYGNCRVECWTLEGPGHPIVYGVWEPYGNFEMMQKACPKGFELAAYRTPPCQRKVTINKNIRGCPVNGNPVQVASGNKIADEVDVALGRLSFTRHYNSLSAGLSDEAKGLGIRWRHSYEASLSVGQNPPPAANIFAIRPDGKVYPFIFKNATWVTDSNINDRLVQLPDSGWRLLRSRSIESFDAAGRLHSIVDIDGKTVTLSYDGENRLAAVTDFSGRQLTFSYNSTNQVESLTTPAGEIFQYRYDGAGNLLSVGQPGGSVREYHYDDPMVSDALTGITDENGDRFATYTYDASGKVMSTEHAGGMEKFQFSYGNVSTTVTDPLGTARTYNFRTVLGALKTASQSQPGGSGCGPASSAIGYDANGNVSSRTDFDGHKTTSTYDLTRNLELTRTEGAGTTAARTISTIWHPDWRIEAQRAEPKKRTTWVYNGQPDPSAGGAVATCAPSDALLPDGKPIVVLCKQIEQATTDETGAAGFSATVTGVPRISTWTYTRYGQVITADGPRTDVNDVTTTTYYDIADSDLGKRGNVATITNALGHVTEFTSYDANGRVTMMTDPNGVTTSFSYDPRGRLTAKTVGGETTSYSYDPVGQLTAVSMPDGTSLTYTYDPAHRLTAIADGAGNRVQYTLDAAGNRVKEEVLDPEGRLVRAQTRVYDTLGRLQNLVQPQ